MSDNSEDINPGRETASKDPLPVDPSNTSDIGQKAEQGVATIKEGLSEQSNEWEDVAERGIPESKAEEQMETYLKHPSPEENDTDE